MIGNMFEYYSWISSLNIDIIYSGPLWADCIESVAKTLNRRLEFDALPLSYAQSVFSVFVEQMNNMMMYSVEKERFGLSRTTETEIPKGIFILGVKNRLYFLQSGNYMPTESVDALRSRLDYVNALSKSELRKLYKMKIKDANPNPESKGAGLGFVEIARRSSAPIEYSFITVENGLTFFSMYVMIGH